MACKYYGNCEHQSGWCQSDSMLIKCTYGLNNLCSERIQKIVRLEEENKELKRLLRLAVEGIERIGKWQHAEEALKLLGDDADD